MCKFGHLSIKTVRSQDPVSQLEDWPPIGHTSSSRGERTAVPVVCGIANHDVIHFLFNTKCTL